MRSKKAEIKLWKKHAILGVMAGLVGSSSICAIAAPKFITSEEDLSEPKILDFQDRLSFGIQLYSVAPSVRPFQAVSGSTTGDYRYQISGATGVEIFYRFSEHMDLGISTSYEYFRSRLRQSSGSTEFQSARMRLFPIEGIAKWQWAQGVWAPEFETGVGIGFFNMELKSTNLNQPTIRDSSAALLAHAAAGVSLAWMEDTNIGIALGYRMMFLQQKEFDATIINVRRKSLSGIYSKATLRYHF